MPRAQQRCAARRRLGRTGSLTKPTTQRHSCSHHARRLRAGSQLKFELAEGAVPAPGPDARTGPQARTPRGARAAHAAGDAPPP